jgi:hydroxyacylglutathione hydrolase
MIIYKTKNVSVFQSGMFQLNSTVVRTEDMVFVVDPGYLPDEIDEIRLHVENIKGKRPVYLFFTHSDYDHIVGFGAFPGAKTIASKEFVESPLQESQIEDLIKYDDEFYISRPYPVEYPKIDHVIESDGQQLVIGDTVLSFYQALGHNNDGLLAVVGSLNLLIAGDYLSDIEFPFVYYRYYEYEKTLKTFQRLVNENLNFVLIPGHGSVTEETSEIQNRIDDSNEYLQLVKDGLSEVRFNEFLQEKNYRFLSIFRKRHRDNLEVWRQHKGRQS